MLELQRIQPEMKRIQQAHKGDRQAMNEELMALTRSTRSTLSGAASRC
jgi:membrane protein insertase Oxa1/YidC/SpoIIIJ